MLFCRAKDGEATLSRAIPISCISKKRKIKEKDLAIIEKEVSSGIGRILYRAKVYEEKIFLIVLK